MSRAIGEPEEGVSRREMRGDTAVRTMEGHRRHRAARAMVRQGLAPGTTTGQAGQAGTTRRSLGWRATQESTQVT